MKLLTVLAVAAVAAGLYRYSRRSGAPARPARVRPFPGDTELAERVRKELAGASAKPVEVRVLRGVVTLSGSVATVTERDAVLARALKVPGVRQVTNLIDTDEPIGEIGTLQSGIATGI